LQSRGFAAYYVGMSINCICPLCLLCSITIGVSLSQPRKDVIVEVEGQTGALLHTSGALAPAESGQRSYQDSTNSDEAAVSGLLSGLGAVDGPAATTTLRSIEITLPGMPGMPGMPDLSKMVSKKHLEWAADEAKDWKEAGKNAGEAFGGTAGGIVMNKADLIRKQMDANVPKMPLDDDRNIVSAETLARAQKAEKGLAKLGQGADVSLPPAPYWLHPDPVRMCIRLVTSHGGSREWTSTCLGWMGTIMGGVIGLPIGLGLWATCYGLRRVIEIQSNTIDKPPVPEGPHRHEVTGIIDTK